MMSLRLLVAVLLFMFALPACATVKPWQRQKLAHPCMNPETRAQEIRATQHMLGAREGSAGAAGEVGAGCGCN